MQCAESGHFREEAFPSVSLTVYFNQTMAELLHILKHPSQEHASPLLWAQFLSAFTEVATILGRSDRKPQSKEK